MSLAGLSHHQLENLYREEPLGPEPTGIWVGRHLGFLDTPGGRRLGVRVVDTLMFVWPRFGVDFERCLWWFGHPRVAAGRFRLEAGPSRWRDTEVLRVEYDVSRLPARVRSRFYDELKPIDDHTILGIGGLNDGPGQGDHFFFELRPAR